MLTITIGTHTLGVGGEIRIASLGIVMNKALPTDAFGTRLRIDAVTSTTVSVNVGRSADTGTYTWSSGVANSILPLLPSAITYPSITWADAEYQTAHSNILSDSEDTVRSVIQHLQTSYSGFDYNHAKCTRDIGYIIDAAKYDWMLDTNFASIVAAYSI